MENPTVPAPTGINQFIIIFFYLLNKTSEIIHSARKVFSSSSRIPLTIPAEPSTSTSSAASSLFTTTTAFLSTMTTKMTTTITAIHLPATTTAPPKSAPTITLADLFESLGIQTVYITDGWREFGQRVWFQFQNIWTSTHPGIVFDEVIYMFGLVFLVILICFGFWYSLRLLSLVCSRIATVPQPPLAVHPVRRLSRSPSRPRIGSRSPSRSNSVRSPEITIVEAIRLALADPMLELKTILRDAVEDIYKSSAKVHQAVSTPPPPPSPPSNSNNVPLAELFRRAISDSTAELKRFVNVSIKGLRDSIPSPAPAPAPPTNDTTLTDAVHLALSGSMDELKKVLQQYAEENICMQEKINANVTHTRNLVDQLCTVIKPPPVDHRHSRVQRARQTRADERAHQAVAAEASASLQRTSEEDTSAITVVPVESPVAAGEFPVGEKPTDAKETVQPTTADNDDAMTDLSSNINFDDGGGDDDFFGPSPPGSPVPSSSEPAALATPTPAPAPRFPTSGDQGVKQREAAIATLIHDNHQNAQLLDPCDAPAHKDAIDDAQAEAFRQFQHYEPRRGPLRSKKGVARADRGWFGKIEKLDEQLKVVEALAADIERASHHFSECKGKKVEIAEAGAAESLVAESLVVEPLAVALLATEPLANDTPATSHATPESKDKGKERVVSPALSALNDLSKSKWATEEKQELQTAHIKPVLLPGELARKKAREAKEAAKKGV